MSRHVLAIFLCIMLVCGGALSWLGWRVLEQDRLLDKQRVQEHLEHAADLITASLERTLSEMESNESLRGVVVLSATEGAVEVRPPDRLLFYPVLPKTEEPPAATYAEGEMKENQNSDFMAAAEFFRTLTRSPDLRVRAGALLRLGRNLRKAGRSEEALAVFNALQQVGDVPVVGLPAELMAREARCSLLESLGRRDLLLAEASAMYTGLEEGRWKLDRPAWEFHLEEAQRWSGGRSMIKLGQDALALANAAEWVYGRWLADGELKGRRILRLDGGMVVITWRTEFGRLSATLGGPDFAASVWSKSLAGRGTRGTLVDADGRTIAGNLDASAPQVTRSLTVAGLPGTLYTSIDGFGTVSVGSAVRRQFLLAGFAVLAMVLLAGSYFITYSISRERAVARMQSEFVSAVSHEFRTPLTSLRQISDMLSKQRIPTEELRQESYEILSRESERLQRLVESVLDFGRMEAGEFRYRLEQLDPATVVGGVVAEFRENAAAQGYCIELGGHDSLPTIRADREALRLALWNLLNNAVKYSPDCRTVWVEMGHEEGRLAIRIRDHGIGIPVSEQAKVFRKFVRGSGARASRIQGAGIGLSIVQRVVEAHQGEVRLLSEPGRGSTFTILLPLEKAA